MDKEQKQICQIRVVFPTETDEMAIEIKKKITSILSEIPDAQVHFALMAGNSRGT